ncbi:hypothetical protein B9479_008312, partial [Cryptococcus floricola]
MVSPVPNTWSEGYGTAFINSITDGETAAYGTNTAFTDPLLPSLPYT